MNSPRTALSPRLLAVASIIPGERSDRRYRCSKTSPLIAWRRAFRAADAVNDALTWERAATAVEDH